VIVLDSSFPIACHTVSDVPDAAIATVARRDKHGYVAAFDKDFRNLAGVTVIPA
jgi:predicted nucleic acid-binding protein